LLASSSRRRSCRAEGFSDSKALKQRASSVASREFPLRARLRDRPCVALKGEALGRFAAQQGAAPAALLEGALQLLHGTESFLPCGPGALQRGESQDDGEGNEHEARADPEVTHAVLIGIRGG
jgi:hypothetical protein